MTQPAFVTPPAILDAEDVHGYTPAAAAHKEKFHLGCKNFLVALGREMGLRAEHYNLTVNAGGMAISGEVSLHADRLHMWMTHDVDEDGTHLLYRKCRSRDHFGDAPTAVVWLADLKDPAKQRALVDHLMKIARPELAKSLEELDSALTTLESGAGAAAPKPRM